MLREKGDAVQASAAKTNSLRDSNPSIRVANSIYEKADAESSASTNDAVSAVASSDLEFSFDSMVINSQAYRQNMPQAKSLPAGPKEESAQVSLIGPPDLLAVEKNAIRQPVFQVRPMQKQTITNSLGQASQPKPVIVPAGDTNNMCWTTGCDADLRVERRYTYRNRGYCRYHYHRLDFEKCKSCDCPIPAITPECVLRERTGVTEIWHPECYGIKTRWGLELRALSLPNDTSKAGPPSTETLLETADLLSHRRRRLWTDLGKFEDATSSTMDAVIEALQYGEEDDALGSAISRQLNGISAILKALHNVEQPIVDYGWASSYLEQPSEPLLSTQPPIRFVCLGYSPRNGC